MQIDNMNLVAHRAARTLVSCIALASLSLIGAPAQAADSAEMASYYGCVNCHSSQAKAAHSVAPSLKRLAEKATRKGDPNEVLQHLLREMRAEVAVHTHHTVSDETVLAILKSLAQVEK